MKIGVFDSGLGGLTVLNAIREHLPVYDYVYYGDTKNLPYGDKTESEIRTFTRNAVLELFQRGALIVIVACNTASAETLRALQEELIVNEQADRRILGVIIPTVEELVQGSVKNALLIGTKRTVASYKYERELMKCNDRGVVLTSCATPELVPHIESGAIDEAYRVLQNHLMPRVGEIDTLILGCTHYTLLKDRIREGYPNLRVISQDEIIPGKFREYLMRHPELESRLTRGNSCTHIITGPEQIRFNSARE